MVLNILLTLILMTLWMSLCGMCLIAGAFLGRRLQVRREKNELSGEELRALERDRRELENFWRYTGDTQK